MATSDKADKAVKAKSTGKTGGTDMKQPAAGPVVPSAAVRAEDAVTVSRIPPSQPIESTLVGKADGGRPAAAPNPAVAPQKLTQPATLAAPAKPAPKPETIRPAARPEPELVSQTVVQKVGFWPLVLGGAVAAGLGAAATVYALPYLPASWQAAAQVDVAALTDAASAAGAEAAKTEVAAALAAMPAPVAAADPNPDQIDSYIREQVKAALAAAGPVPGQAASTAQPSGDVTARIAALQAQLETQGRQIADLNARPQLDPAAMQQVQALAQGAGQIRADIDAAAAQARDSLAAVQAEAAATAQRAQAVASVAVLGAALEGGSATPSEAVQQLEQAGVAVPEPLAQEDLPTLDQLQMSFDAPARAALTASLKAESKTEGPLGAVSNFLRVQTGARSVEPREGADPDAVLSRASALVAQGDLPTALTELQGLPEAGQAAMAGWVAQANAYLAAETALKDVAKSLN